jgi:hypothetical protein
VATSYAPRHRPSHNSLLLIFGHCAKLGRTLHGATLCEQMNELRCETTAKTSTKLSPRHSDHQGASALEIEPSPSSCDDGLAFISIEMTPDALLPVFGFRAWPSFGINPRNAMRALNLEVNLLESSFDLGTTHFPWCFTPMDCP